MSKDIVHDVKNLYVGVEIHGDSFALTFRDGPKGQKWTIFMPAHNRIDLAMALLQADGAKVHVKLTYPRPRKAKKDLP